jgi:hypothetical protein
MTILPTKQSKRTGYNLATDRCLSMKKRPHILVIAKTKDESKKKKYISLTKKYNLFFFLFNKKNSIDQELRLVDQFLKKYLVNIDGVIAFNDDSSLLASAISELYNLYSPNPTSLCQIQHKAFFLNQLNHKNYIPQTISIDEKNKNWQDNVRKDSFIKPTKGSLSEGALKIKNDNKQQIILPKIKVSKFEKSFFKKYFDLPLNQFILQPYINQRQFTLDGLIQHGKITKLGITESIYDKQKESFIRFDFPIFISNVIENELNVIISDIAKVFNFDHSLFNLEFFLSQNNQLTIIELNTRASIVFEDFYQQYFGKSMTEMMIDISLNKIPKLKIINERLYCKSYILRKYFDYVVASIPTRKYLSKLIKNNNLENIRVLGKTNKKLSQQKQDSYSYRYAIIDICGMSEDEIELKYQKTKSELDNLITFFPVSH